MATNTVFIPVFISTQTYNPARVLPRLFFYNGTRESLPYFIEGYTTGNTILPVQFNRFPYFDHYNDNTPNANSRSLLFQNEVPNYGETPTNSLYTEYWEKYVKLLYNPRTRLIQCSAIIPLADYFKIELNDIVNFRGNYFHLRAINNYNLSTGECDLQLLGPIIEDSLNRVEISEIEAIEPELPEPIE
jgi:hypothetical protein